MSPGWVGAGLGLLAGLGIVGAVAASPPLRRPRLDARLGPYLRDSNRPFRAPADPPTRTPFPTAERLLRPYLDGLARGVDRAVGASPSVRRRLDQAGRGQSLEQFRAEQVLWGAAGFGVGLLVVGLAAIRGQGNPVALLLFCVLTTTLGVLARDRWLSRELRRRESRMLTEFPTVAELLALAVSAGESPLAALARVSRLSRGELAQELARALADARAGAPLVVALEGVARRTSLPLLARFVDGIAIALERGTPLADVLRSQAADVREAGKRTLLEAGGRKEIAMLVPVVFLVLPVVVLFALFPGFYTLNLTVP
ncbi:MAG TPA: type II secretion system F family protein [Mycobacteriales bacterium]|nr:type II secretion system F family protein [Mycobacteriales bacterium]